MTLLELENLLVYTKILDIENFEYVIDKYKLERKDNETILEFYRQKAVKYLLKH